MNLLLALGLVVYSVAEISVGLISHMQDSETFHFLISLTQFPGILLWAIGVLGYLRASNFVLRRIRDRSLLTIVIALPVVSSIIVIFAIILQTPERNPIEVFTTAPVTMGLGIIVMALAVVTVLYRGGHLSRPLALNFGALLLIFIREAVWCFAGYSPVETLGQATSIVAYLLIGASLALAKRMEES